MPTIALVDDDRNILTSVSIALEAEGYRTMTYSDGASVRQLSRSGSNPAARQPEPTTIPRAPPTARCSLRSASLWRFPYHASAATISPPNWRSA
jgi:hypothetical protein